MTKRIGESGNIFFTLFGAVALVGVIGVATSNLMRGPVGTVMKLNQTAKAESQLQIARKMAALEAAQNINNDCEPDGFLEPLAPDKVSGADCSGLGLTGGGCMPAAVGASQNDPWGTRVGYCAWDHGPTIGVCDPANLLDGVNATTETVIAVISAGPNRTFETTCGDDPAYIQPANGGGDDIVMEWTYDDAVQGAGGLWGLKSSDPDTAEILNNKNIEVGGSATFGSGASFASNVSLGAGSLLDLTAGSLLNLPDQSELIVCSLANDEAMRVDNSIGLVLQICDFNGVGDWVDIGGSGSASSVSGSEGDVQFNSGDALYAVGNFNYDVATDRLRVGGSAAADDTLEVTGTADISGDLEADQFRAVTGGTAGNAGLSFNSAGTLGVYGSGTNVGLSVAGSSRLIANSLGVDVIGNFDASGTGDIGGTLDVGGDTRITADLDVSGALEVDGDISDALGAVTINDDLVVNQSLQVGTSFAADNFELDTIGSGEGLYQYSSGTGDGFALRTAGVNRIMADGSGDINMSGDVGIALGSAPTTDLDIGGILRLRSDATAVAGGVCTLNGSIAYTSGDELLICSNVTGNWETIGTSGGGGGGGGGIWQRSTGIIRIDPTYFNSTDDFVIGSLQLDDEGSGDQDQRMFFENSTGAFRAGVANGTEWDTRGDYSIGLGQNVQATTSNSIAIGSHVQARANNSVAIGVDAVVAAGAANSMAFGLGVGAGIGALPQVSGAGSFGIFMQDQSDVDLAANNTMALFGGRLLIDPNEPATELTTSLSLTVDVEGDVGAVQFCSEEGTFCFTAEDVSTGATGAPGNDREMIFNSAGALATDTSFVFTSAGNLGLGTANPLTDIHVLDSNPEILLDLTAPGDSAIGFSALGTVYAGMEWNSTNNDLELAIDATNAGIGDFGITTGGDLALAVANSGDVSIGAIVAQTKLDVDGTIKMSYGGEACDANRQGAIHFDSVGEDFYVCQDGANWQRIITTGGGAGTPAGGNDREIQFNSGGDLAGNSNFVFTSTGNFGLGLSNPDDVFDVVGSAQITGPTVLGSSLNVTGQVDFSSGLNVTSATDLSSTLDVTGATTLNNTLSVVGANATTLGGSLDVTGQVDFSSGLNVALATGLSSTLDVTGATTLDGLLTTTADSNMGGLVTFTSTGAVLLPVGDTGQQPSVPQNGMIRYNTDNDKFEAFQGGIWQDILTSAVAGGAAAPDRGIQFNSGGDFAADANFVFTSAGNLGLGTAAPSQRLSIRDGNIFVNNTASAAGLLAWGQGNTSQYSYLQLGENVTGRDWIIDHSEFYPNALRFSYDGTGHMILTSAAYLGLGTMAPSYKLHVARDENATTAAAVTNMNAGANARAQLRIVTDGGQTLLSQRSVAGGDLATLYNTNAGGFYITSENATSSLLAFQTGAAATDRMTIDHGGTVRFTSSGAVLLPVGNTAEQPSAPENGMIRYNTDSDKFEAYQGGVWQDILTSAVAGGASAPDRGIQFNSGGDFAADANFVFTSAGRLGVGTDAPVYGLHVSTNVNGVALLESTQHAWFQVATSDDSGSSALTAYINPSQQWNVGTNSADGANFENDFSINDVTNSNQVLSIENVTGNVGLSDVTPQTRLDVNGTIKMSYGGEACDVNRQGAIHFDSVGEDFYVCQDGSTWQRIITTGGGAGTPAGGNDREIQFNSGGDLAGDANFAFTSAGLLGVGTSSPIFDLHVENNQNAATYNAVVNYDAGATASANLVAGANGGYSALVQSSVAGGDVGILYNNTSAGLIVASEHATSSNLAFQTGAAAVSRMVIDHDGLVTFTSSGAVLLPVGDTSSQPSSPQNGMIRYNTDNDKFEAYQGGVWQDILTSAVAGGASAPDRGIQFNSGGDFAADANFVFTSAGNLGLGDASPARKLSVVDSGVSAVGVFVNEENSNSVRNSIAIARRRADATAPLAGFGSRFGFNLESSTDGVILNGGGIAAVYEQNQTNDTTDRDIAMTFETVLDNAVIEQLRISSDGIVLFQSTGAARLNIGDTAQRPSTPQNGMIRYNTDNDKFEAYQGGAWQDILTSAVAGGASAPDRGIQFNSGGDFAADANFVFTSAGYLGIGTAAPESRLSVNNTSTATAEGTEALSGNVLYVNPSADQVLGDEGVGRFSYAADSSVIVPIASSNAINSLTGSGASVSNYGSGAIDNMTGVSGWAYDATNSNTAYLTGGWLGAQNDSGTAGEVIGAEVYSAAGGTVTSSYGLKVDMYQWGTLANRYGVYIGNSSGSATNDYGIYQLSSAQNNYFAGQVGVGSNVTAPSTQLDVDGTLKIAYGGEDCDAAREGAIRYDSAADTFSFCAATANDWESITLGSGTLAALGDTNITAPTDGEILYYSGSEWVNNSLAINDLSDGYFVPGIVGQYNFFLGHEGGPNIGGNNYRNMGIGEGALDALDSAQSASWPGDNNLAVGFEALTNLESGERNTAIGIQSQYNSVNGDYNVSVGNLSQYFNVSGEYNVSVGTQTLQYNQGSNNTAIGHDTMRYNSSGLFNTAVGRVAMIDNVDGNHNVAIGASSLQDSVASSRNVAVGYQAMRDANDSTTETLSENVAIGFLTLRGGGADASENTGTYNVAVGSLAGRDVTSGSRNTLLGRRAGWTLGGGSDNILIGNNADVLHASASNYVNLGDIFYGSMGTGELYIGSTGALTMPDGTTAQRPGTLAGTDAANGMLRYNTETGRFEGYQAGAWQDILTGAIAGGASAPDRGIQFNSGGSFMADAGLTYSSAGNLTATGRVAIGPDASVNGGQLLYPGDTFSNVLTIEEEVTDMSDQYAIGIVSYLLLNPATPPTTLNTVALDGEIRTEATNTEDFNYLTGLYGEAVHQGSGDVYELAGASLSAYNDGNGNVGASYGLNISSGNYGVGTVSNNYAIKIASPGNTGGIVANNYGLFVGDQTGEGTESYAIFSEGGMNYFGGDVKIAYSSAAPSARLDVDGTIKIAYSGEACDAAREGGIHYNSSDNNFYVCQSAGSWSVLATGTPSAAAPDRGIQFNSGGNFTADTNFVFTSAGRLGIGTSSPNTQLHIATVDSIVEGLRIENTGGSSVSAGFSGGSAGANFTFSYGGTAVGDIILKSTGGVTLARAASANVGVGVTNTQTRLDVDGTIKMAYGGEACDAAREGGIHYNSSDNNFYVCQSAGSWSVLATGTPSAAAPDRGIQFNSGGDFAAEANFTYTSDGDLIVGSYQIENTGTGSEDSRMFFDVSNSAFRAGSAAGVEWDYASSGQYSTAFGQGTVASGDGSTAMGTFTVASGNGSVAMGGLGATASGSGSVAMGGFSRAIGGGSVAIGNIARATETYSVAIGSNATASGYASTAMGRQTTASGTQSAALGSYASAGAYAMAIGLSSTAPGTHPVVTGQQSLGIFMGNQNAVDLSSVNTMGLFGGSMVIDPAVPATNLSPDTALEIEGTLKIAYGGEACDVAREGAIRFVSASNSFAFCANNANDWETVSLGAGTLAALSDTTIAASPANGQVLYYSGSVWISNRLAINDLSDGTADYTSGNLFLGQGVVNASTTGANNVVVGTSAADSMTSGQRNVILGSEVAEDLTTGHSSVLLGYRTASAVTGGYQNVAIGAYSGQNMSYNNTYLGERAGRDGAGNNNTMIGRVAGMGVTSGNNNVILGSQSESAIFASGSNNILLGAMIDTPQAATSNYLNLGNIFYGSMGTGELYIGSNGALRMPVGGDAQRPGTVVGTTAVNGMLRYNSASDRFEGYQGGSWQDILTGAIAGGAAAPDRGIQFNSGGSFHASSGLVYSSTGNLGVGASDPQTRLVVSDNTSSLPYVPYDEALARFVNENSVSPAVMVEGFARQSLLRLMRADGTAAAPTAVTAGKLLGSMAFFGYDGVNYSSNASARMRARAAEDFSVGSMGTSLEFMTTSLGEGNAEKRIVIDGNGNIGMGSDIDYASARLHVDGTLKIAYGGEACDADREGAIRFVSASNSFAFCADTGNDWETVSLGAGVTEIDDLSDAATNYTSGSMYIGQGAPYTATGIDNTTLGLDAGTGLTSGASNTLIGAYAGEALTTQISNTAVGTYVLNANTGNYNTSVGNFSLVQSLGASNTALGSSAATNLINGNDNVFIGELAGRGDNTGFTWDGAENVIIGQNAAVDLDGTNNQNTIIGSDTAATLTGGGSGNILLGYGVDVPSATTSNYINIGNVIYGSADTGYSRVAGTFQISSSGEACDAAREGAMQFGSGGSNIFEVCANSATGWEQLALGGTVSGALDDLSDVNTTGFADGNVLLYSAGASAWVPGDAQLVGAFTDLTDTPANYTGQGGRFAVVNSGETALEFTDQVIESVSGEPAPNTIDLSDLGDVSASGATGGQYLTYDSASGNWVAGTISSSSVSAAGADSQIQFNSGGGFAANANFVYTSAGLLGLGTSTPSTALDININQNDITSISVTNTNAGIGSAVAVGLVSNAGAVMMGQGSAAGGGLSSIGASSLGGLRIFSESATADMYFETGDGPTTGRRMEIDSSGLVRFTSSGAVRLPVGDTSEQPSTPQNGMIRYNTDNDRFEGYQGGSWQDIVTGSLSGGSAAAPNRGIQFNSADSFAADATFTYTSAGNLGVGTATPGVKLDVVGDIRTSNNLILQPVSGLAAPTYISAGYFALNNLTDVDTTGFADGNVLLYSAGASGWIPGTVSGGGGGALNDLSDATTVYPSGNMYIGQGAGAGATTAINMTAVGINALASNTVSNFATAIGAYAAENAIASTQWSAIVAVGSEAGRNVGSTGGFTAIGNEALKDFAGERNTAVGNIAMFTGPSGGGNDNTGVGDGVGAYMSGDRNTLLGTSAFRGGFGGDYDHAGDDNVIIGYNAAMNVQGATTSNNVIIGTNTAAALRNGSSNLLIGNDVDVSGANAANEMNIGDVIYASGLYNATTHLGINNATPNVELDVTGDIEYTGTITDVSDRRLKTDITPLNTDEMMAKIAQINTYKFRMKDDPKGRIEFGVMAQELEEQFPELVKTANDEMGTKSVNYVGLITPLIEVSKELKSENDTLRAELAEMKTAQAKFEADIMQQVNGLKAHTGYGISKAQMGLWMLVIMFGSLSLWFVIGGMVRNRQNKQL